MGILPNAACWYLQMQSTLNLLRFCLSLCRFWSGLTAQRRPLK